MKADKVIFGNIYTVDRNHPKAGAAAIDGGKFIYVGDAIVSAGSRSRDSLRQSL